MEEATAAGRGGAVREALIYGYPRLAALIDSFFKRLHQETKVRLVKGIKFAIKFLCYWLPWVGPFKAMDTLLLAAVLKH